MLNFRSVISGVAMGAVLLLPAAAFANTLSPHTGGPLPRITGGLASDGVTVTDQFQTEDGTTVVDFSDGSVGFVYDDGSGGVVFSDGEIVSWDSSGTVTNDDTL